MKKEIKITLGIIIFIFLLFIVDLVCIFTINRPLFGIKEDNGDSTNLIYRGLFYDTYNCHEYSVPQIKQKGAKFSCAVIEFDEEIESKYQLTEVKNVSINITDISLTGATIIIKDTNINPYTYGEWYKIEKEVNGKWYEVKPKLENYGFNAIGYLPDENNEVKFVIDWEWLYDELPIGNYRILKEVGSYYISVKFSIATTSDKKIEVIKSDVVNLNKFNKYLERDNKVVYLAGNLEEIFYYNESNIKMSLKDYITKSYQTIDDSIKALTDLMIILDELKDGGTVIYKSNEYDITIVKCNTVTGNKNIFIGDKEMSFDSKSMCR